MSPAEIAALQIRDYWAPVEPRTESKSTARPARTYAPGYSGDPRVECQKCKSLIIYLRKNLIRQINVCTA